MRYKKAVELLLCATITDSLYTLSSMSDKWLSRDIDGFKEMCVDTKIQDDTG